MLLLNKKNIFTFYLLYNWSLDVPPKFFWTQSQVHGDAKHCIPTYVAGGGVSPYSLLR